MIITTKGSALPRDIVNGDVPSLQLRSTIVNAIPTSFQPINFDTVDVQTEPSVLSANASDLSQIVFNESGTYDIAFSLSVRGNSSVTVRLIYSDGSVVPGSVTTTESAASDEQILSRSLVVNVTAEKTPMRMEYIASAGGTSSVTDIVLGVARMRGSRGAQGPVGAVGPIGPTGPKGDTGPQGPAGSGSSVSLSQDGVLVGVFDTIDVTGSGIALTDNGDGSASLNVDGSAGTGNTFGSQFAYAKSDGLTVSNATQYVRKLRLTTASLPAGTYRIGWSYQWSRNSNSTNFLARVQLNDSIDLHQHIAEPSDSSGTFQNTGTDQRYQTSGFDILEINGGIQNIDLDFASQNSGVVSSMWNARLEIWRVQ